MLFSIVICGILFFGGVYFIVSHFQGVSEDNIVIYETMIRENTKTLAILDNDNKTSPISFIKYYDIEYSFSVGEDEYKGHYQFSRPPDTDTLTVFYLSTDPAVNCADPWESIKEEYSKSSGSYLIFGIGMIFAGVVLSIGSYKYFQKRRNKEQEHWV